MLGARPWRIVRQIILPAALPAAIAGGSLCLLLTVNEFGIVLFIGAKGVITLPLLVYDKAIQEFDYQAACVIAVVNVALSLGLFGSIGSPRAGWEACDAGLVALGQAGACGASRRWCVGVVFLAPLAVILAASFAGQWNGVLPSGFTFGTSPNPAAAPRAKRSVASLVTGVVASLLALISGTWAALALRAQGGGAARMLGVLFFVPSAVPSVSVGLGLLVAFSQRPLLLNGTTAIVFIAHFVLISAFTFGNVSAGLARLAPDFEEVASCLGATPFYRLRRVTLPLIAPYLIAAFSLSFALSMGELGATVMVYPPGWVTLPVGIFALTDRGEIFSGAALTMILVVVTLALLLVWSAFPRCGPRREAVNSLRHPRFSDKATHEQARWS